MTFQQFRATSLTLLWLWKVTFFCIIRANAEILGYTILLKFPYLTKMCKGMTVYWYYAEICTFDNGKHISQYFYVEGMQNSMQSMSAPTKITFANHLFRGKLERVPLSRTRGQANALRCINYNFGLSFSWIEMAILRYPTSVHVYCLVTPTQKKTLNLLVKTHNNF